MGYAHLHTHSYFSFHAGVNSVQELVSRAKVMGMRSLALTDTDRTSGLILFYLACKEEGIHPILGVELTESDESPHYVVLIAKNAEGYGDLCEIVSKRHLNPHFSFSALFSKRWPNLIFMTHFMEIIHLIRATPNRENLYAELISNSEETRLRSKVLAADSEKVNVPVVATNNVYFVDRQDWEIHRILTAIGLCSTLSRLKPGEYASSGAFLKSEQDMKRIFARQPQALANIDKIVSQCNVELRLNEWIMPRVTVPEGYTPDTYLRMIAREGLERNYAGTIHYEKAQNIQEMELEVIQKLGYPSYFLIVREVRDWANEYLSGGHRRRKDCSILRGSAANSITFYNIDVSDLDPIKYDLYFQRFLNEDRASPPDADLDFGWDERDEVLEYIIDRWGEDRVAITCTTNHFRGRAAFRETAKVFGYSEEQISEIAKSWKTVSSRIFDPEIERILTIAGKIRGKPRFLGQHPGGVLITNDPIWRHVGLERSGGEKDRIITQVDMHNGIDELGLIKFDILGNGSLSVFRDAIDQLREQGLRDPEAWNLEKCYADPKVKEIIAKGRTKGIFYIESPAQTRLNKKAQVETFEELAITSSLVRPAGASYCLQFIDRHRKMKMGVRDWEFLHPSLEPILSETHDVCAFQEDVTKICHHVAGLSFKQADKIRKMMNSLHEGSVEDRLWIETEREFLAGCIKNSGLTVEQARELWMRVSSFTGFSFCKSHSASYAQLSFKCTYLKAHYPAQFLAAVISNNHGFYSKDAYINEARRWGIRILPLDINKSGIKYVGKHNWMRPGIMHVRNLTDKTSSRIVEEKGIREFANVEDFISRVGAYRHEVENLVLAGAFDGFGLNQPELLYVIDGIYGRHRSLAENGLQFDVFGTRDRHPNHSDYSLTEKCLNELHILGFMLSGNILDILDLHPKSKGTVPAGEIANFVGKGIKVFGWPVTERVHTVSTTGKTMMFLTLEDQTGSMDVIFWPRNYGRFADVLAKPGPYEVWGKVTEEWDTHCLEAVNIRSAEWSPSQIDFELASQRLTRSAGYVYTDLPGIVAA